LYWTLDARREEEAAAPSLAGCYTAALVGRSADRAADLLYPGSTFPFKNA